MGERGGKNILINYSCPFCLPPLLPSPASPALFIATVKETNWHRPTPNPIYDKTSTIFTDIHNLYKHAQQVWWQDPKVYTRPSIRNFVHLERTGGSGAVHRISDECYDHYGRTDWWDGRADGGPCIYYTVSDEILAGIYFCCFQWGIFGQIATIISHKKCILKN